MVPGQVCNRKRGQRAAKLRKSVSIPTAYYDRLTKKATEQGCPYSTVLEVLMDNYLEGVKVW